MKTVSSLLKPLIPPIVTSFAKATLQQYGYFGDYSTWEKALNQSSGYSTEGILEKVGYATQQVLCKKAAFERDSVIFDKPEYSWPTLTSFLWVQSQLSEPLNVLDYGGALGSTFLQCQKFFSENDELTWNIIEQSHFVEYGQKHVSHPQLHFFKSIDDLYQQTTPNLVLLSSVLPYIPNPQELLQQVLEKQPAFFMIDRTLVLPEGKTRLTLQKVPPSIYDASYPAWIFSESELLSWVPKPYELFESFDALNQTLYLKNPRQKAMDRGYLFQKRSL